jgi:hypothetical protein
MTKIKITGLCKFGLLILLTQLFFSCEDPWADHYQDVPEKVNTKLWDALKEEERFSAFVQQMEAQSLDTLFRDGLTYTLFIPSEEAIKSILDTASNASEILLYHILESLFIGDNQEDEKQLLTSLGKYVLFNPGGVLSSFDEIPISYTSPLHLDGKFYELDGLALPRPNLYEYIALTNPFLKGYIDSKDSIYMDKELSTPIGFDEFGNTVYDTVYGMVNTFEYEYFPLSEEFRNRRATFLLFTLEQLDAALDEMASDINLGDGSEIPFRWKSEVLMPALMTSAIFKGELEYTDLMKDTLTSITGETVVIDHTNVNPDSRFRCSNGMSYLYDQLIISDLLYLGGNRKEGEHLVDSVGQNYNWKDEVILGGQTIGIPRSLKSNYGSGGRVLSVKLPPEESFSMEFTIQNVLPMRYRILWRGNSSLAGNYRISVNGENVGEFDTWEFFQKKIWSVKDGIIFRKDDGDYNIKDFWVENITEYGDVSVRIEFLGPSDLRPDDVGMIIDYVELIPEI